MTTEALCYIDGNCAWFTTQSLATQWGDDWNDAPYEHNAGDPYEDWDRPAAPRWRLTKVFFDGPLETPADRAGLNSRYSVEAINAGATLWLRSGDDAVGIPAGVSISQFTDLVYKAGGKVYLSAAQG